jgi:uncharacterized membrane protein YuzA (DUF378 family)
MHYAKKLKRIDVLGTIFSSLGALNWGIIGAGGKNLVLMIFSKWPLVVQTLYILIGVSGLYGFWSLCRMFDSKKNVTKPTV